MTGQEIRAWRKRLQLTQVEVAQAADTCQSLVSDLEKSVRASKSVRARVIAALRAREQELFVAA